MVGAKVTVRGAEPMHCLLTPRAAPQLQPAYGSRHRAVPVRPGRAAGVAFGYTATTWGVLEVGPVHVTSFACDGLLELPEFRVPVRRVAVLPLADSFTSRAQLPHAAGLSGAHRSRRPGEGGELAGVRRFQPGDRLRRIDWRTTVRTGETHVNATLSERDAEIVIMIDVLHETALGTAVRAAAAIAGHYASTGDRVTLTEFGSLPRRLRAGTGRRHLLAALEWLAGVRPHGGSGDEAGERLLTSALPRGRGLVFMLTPLVDERSVAGLTALAVSRRPLVAVDTLGTGRAGSLPERIWRLERENFLDRLRESGVPVEPWHGSASLDAVLRDVTRAEMRR
ncbi:DUF58 domain-containing protein [Thermoactinospora rubra]|uniref:DUF58 domain-containing protein n=1 Tax=Thermoactinospora rubra TaxID=1088767 RepID=UPI000A1221DF|nr:DUF58 domain-containing protein [Thermoactinospora rubra]